MKDNKVAVIKQAYRQDSGDSVEVEQLKKQLQLEQERNRNIERQYQAILATASDAIISINEQGIIQTANEAATVMFAYETNELIGIHIRTLLTDEDSETSTVLNSKRECTGKRKSGETFIVSLARSRIQTAETYNELVIIRDISEQKQLVKTLQKQRDELIASNKSLEQFAYAASHDLQEPLRMVTSYTELLARRYQDKLDENANEFINFAVDGANRMQSLIQDLLQFSRLNSHASEHVEVDMNQVLEYAEGNLAVILDETGSVIEKDKLPRVYGDAGQLRQLMQNLLGNAIKYRDTERLTKVRITVSSHDNNYIFCVADNGIGISSTYFDRIFEIFKRLHNKSSYSGTGIGLALCKKIIDSHGGRIWVESTPGVGSQFYFSLKASASEENSVSGKYHQ